MSDKPAEGLVALVRPAVAEDAGVSYEQTAGAYPGCPGPGVVGEQTARPLLVSAAAWTCNQLQMILRHTCQKLVASWHKQLLL